MPVPKLQDTSLAEHDIGDPVTGPVGAQGCAEASGADHVQLTTDQHRLHAGSRGGIVGVVAVDQEIDVRLDIGEHAADDMALALQPFPPHHGARGTRVQHGMVGGVIVIDIDNRVGQRRLEVGDDPADRGLLVAAWYQHRHARLVRDDADLPLERAVGKPALSLLQAGDWG